MAPNSDATSSRVNGTSAEPISETASKAKLQEAIEDAPELLDIASAISAARDTMVERSSASMPTPDREGTPTMRGHAPAEPGEAPGAQFIAWLRDGIASHRLIINDSRALVHTVAGTAFLVSPGVFQRYAQEHLEITEAARRDKMAAWEWIQKHFERLRIHKKRNGLNIWTCEVTDGSMPRHDGPCNDWEPLQ